MARFRALLALSLTTIAATLAAAPADAASVVVQ
ncbi:MAG: hypothetical protein JWP53_3711, partial [Conexibacter sp.]|nr:hypothetical protein [Conexibacter sp.]